MTAHALSSTTNPIEGLCAVIDRAYNYSDALRAVISAFCRPSPQLPQLRDALHRCSQLLRILLPLGIPSLLETFDTTRGWCRPAGHCNQEGQEERRHRHFP